MLLLFMIAFSLLAPLAGPASAGDMENNAGQAVETPATGDESRESQPTIDDPVATEVATEEPTEAPTEEPEWFEIDVRKWVCDDPTFDAASASYDEIRAACPGGMAVTFTASDAYGYEETQTTSNASFTTPVEEITVAESIPAGYAEPIVFCAWTEGGQTSAFDSQPSSGGTILLRGKGDEMVTCDWFNIIQPDTTPSDLIVYKWECPAGYDETLPTADPILDCTQLQNGVTFTLDHPDPAETDLQSMTGDAIDGAVMFGGVEPGPYTLVETLPAGWDHGFLWECADSQDNYLVSMASGEAHAIDILGGEEIHCKWFNVPMEPESVHYADMTIYKYTCPAGYDRSAPGADPVTDCPDTTDGITFNLTGTDPATADMTSTTGNPMTGAAYFGNLPVGDYTITEEIPAGTEYAFIDHCIGLIDGVQRAYPLMIDGSFDFGVVGNDGHLTCHWYNVPMEEPQPTDITIYKYTCPAGYNVHAPGADPVSDCPDTTDGITFNLTGNDPNTNDQVATTGNPMTGAVYFNGLMAGSYTVTESVPANIEEVFILDCIGLMDGMQRPVPLSFGASFSFDVTGYEGHITCHWYNVPEDPHGSLTVIKYACWTEEYVSEVDCEIYEDGQAFDLLAWNGSGWTVVDTRTTNATGSIAWGNLPGGSYVLDEHNAEPCSITSTALDSGEHILVTEGEETVVKVYNCGYEQQWEIPTKYPNTGVPPASGEEETAPFAAAMPLAALGLVALVRNHVTHRPTAIR